jgi:DNA topoisomerase III
MKGVHENIVKESRVARALFIWTDCDREGEHIGSEIESAARKSNAQIEVKRARFSNLERAYCPAYDTDISHIIHAAQHPVPLDYRQVAAVNARLELDLRVGAAFTRFQTMTLQNHFAALKEEKNIVSYGTLPSLRLMIGGCQFPTMGFIVDRWRRVENFIPEPFWSIKLSVVREGIEVKFTWKRGHLFDRLCCLCLYEMCLEKGMARVASIVTKPRSKWFSQVGPN